MIYKQGNKYLISDKEDTTFMTCIECGNNVIERHHIFNAYNRDKSEKYHLTCCLCPVHHRDNKLGVHGLNKILDTKLKVIAQKLFTAKYKDKEFIKIFGKNYL